ncbi:hypothetical protein ACIGEZ_26680 [Streptomyces sp. NPDC085481]|uniref:hypothetical protein n=1 Tax=Streptomyces sp. NPDC085481 TaxID=3365727 RepID=UPI0037D526F3
MGRRIVKAGLAAGAALMLAACGGGSDPAAIGSTGGADGGGKNGGAGEGGSDGGVKTAPLGRPGTLTVSFCHDIPNGNGGELYALTVRSLSAKDAAVVAERSLVLPEGVEPTSGCGSDGPDHDESSAFNKDFTQVAAIVSATTDRAAAFDLTTGQEISPPDKDTFAKPPKNDGAAFHPVTGRLWYDLHDSATGYASRDPKGGPSTEERVAEDKVPDLVKRDGATANTILAINGDSVATPQGGIVATGNSTFGLHLSRVDTLRSDGFLSEIETVGLGEKEEWCEPSFWRDATTLVCSEFKQLTFSADYKKVLKTEQLVPENDRISLPPVLAPDGKSFAFLSHGEDDQWALFRGDFSGGQPVKIGNVDRPIDGAEHHRTALVRWS